MTVTVPEAARRVGRDPSTVRRWIDRIASSDRYRDATSIARRLGWAKTHDAEYVALAMTLQVPLITLDRRLAAGASRLVRVLTPPELAGS